MRNGDGSIQEVLKKDGGHYSPKHWRICVSYTVTEQDEFGRTLVDERGKPVKRRYRVQKRCEGTKAEAKALRDQIIEERDDDGRLLSEIEAERKAAEGDKHDVTLSEMVRVWDGARRTAGKASERTLNDDLRWMRHVERHLGDVALKDIDARLVEQTYAAIREERGLSGTSMNHIHVLLKNVFQKAIDYDLIYKNPCAHVTTPRRDNPNRKALSQEEAARLMAEVQRSEDEAWAALEDKEGRMAHIGKDRDRSKVRGIHGVGNVMAVRIGLATGMRRGEVFGLVWKNVDLEKRVLHVCQSLTTKGTVKVPKTAAGIRTVAIDEHTAQRLARWKERQAAELAKLGLEQLGETPVCCSDVGGWYGLDNFERWWRAWRGEHGFEGLKFHELRHTQATQLLANGVDVKTVQTRMGHASPTITLGWYAHAIPAKDQEAAQLLEDLFSGEGGDKVVSPPVIAEPENPAGEAEKKSEENGAA